MSPLLFFLRIITAVALSFVINMRLNFLRASRKLFLMMKFNIINV